MKRSLKRGAARTAILIVAGLAAFAAGALVVNAATTPQKSATTKKRGKPQTSFRIRAQLMRQLQPGAKVPLKISLSNNRSKPLWLTRLTVVLALDKAHEDAGCSLARDYRVEQLPKKFFPYKISKRKIVRVVKGKKKRAQPRWKALSAKKRQGKPTLTMLSLPDVNQDACKGATLTVSFDAKAIAKKPKVLKAAPK